MTRVGNGIGSPSTRSTASDNERNRLILPGLKARCECG